MRLTYFLCIGAFALFGCRQSPETVIIGKWVESAPNEKHDLISAFASSLVPTFSVEVQSDHKFRLKLPNVKLEISSNTSSVQTASWVEGAWTLQGRELSFTVSQLDGKPIDAVRKEFAAKVDEAKRQATLRALQENAAQANAARANADQANGQSGSQQPQSTGTAGNPPSSAPSHVDVVEKLVLPQSASLSEDQKRLLVRFEDGAQAPVEFIKG